MLGQAITSRLYRFFSAIPTCRNGSRMLPNALNTIIVPYKNFTPYRTSYIVPYDTGFIPRNNNVCQVNSFNVFLKYIEKNRDLTKYIVKGDIYYACSSCILDKDFKPVLLQVIDNNEELGNNDKQVVLISAEALRDATTVVEKGLLKFVIPYCAIYGIKVEISENITKMFKTIQSPESLNFNEDISKMLKEEFDYKYARDFTINTISRI